MEGPNLRKWNMSTNQGFSLTEVLVSLVLITSTSLALLKQQWQVSQLFTQTDIRANRLSQSDNAVERSYNATW